MRTKNQKQPMTLFRRFLFLFSFWTLSLAASAGAGTANASQPAPAPDTTGRSILLVIDGVERGKLSELKAVDSLVRPEQIKSINVLKGEAALKKYGEKGRDGVLEITSKKEGEVAPAAAQPAGTQAADTLVFEKVEQQASFPGGTAAWMVFLQNNLKVSTPTDHHAPQGVYRVTIRFIVHRDGHLSHFETLSHPGYGTEMEALRVMTLSPDWQPAVQNGQVVSSYHTQTITFVVGRKSSKPVRQATRKKNRHTFLTHGDVQYM